MTCIPDRRFSWQYVITMGTIVTTIIDPVFINIVIYDDLQNLATTFYKNVTQYISPRRRKNFIVNQNILFTFVPYQRTPPHFIRELILVTTWCFSDRASWIDYILITNFDALIIIYS